MNEWMKEQQRTVWVQRWHMCQKRVQDEAPDSSRGEILQGLWAYQIYKPGFLFVIWVRQMSSFKKDVSVC